MIEPASSSLLSCFVFGIRLVYSKFYGDDPFFLDSSTN